MNHCVPNPPRALRQGHCCIARLLLLVACLALPVLASPPAPPRLMLATDYHAGIDVSRYWVSEKLDGVRARWNGRHLETRAGHRIHAPTWFTRGWPSQAMDGELWMGRGRFDTTSGIVRANRPDDQSWRGMRFMLFDLPDHDGPFDARVGAMRVLAAEAGVRSLAAVTQWRVADRAALDARLARLVAGGAEGLMLHHGSARYTIGRNQWLLKYKPFDDAEARVVGHTAGRGKYAGMLGALIVQRPDGLRFRLGSGLSDAQRADPPPLGSHVTYRYNGLTSKGTPRFARFMRIRHELPPRDPK